MSTPILSVPKTSVIYAKVLFDFHASSTTEMSLNVGETIEVIQRGPSGGWSRSSKGAFPTDYVEFALLTTIPPSKTHQTVGLQQTIPSHQTILSQQTTTKDISSAFEDLQKSSEASQFASTQQVKHQSVTLQKDPVLSSFNDQPFIATTEISQNSIKADNAAVLQSNKRQSVAAQKDSFFAAELQQSEAIFDASQFAKTTKSLLELTSVNSFNTLKKTELASSISSVFAVVKFSKAAGSATELSIVEGETLLVLKQEGEWWYGSTIGANTKKGFFPYNYVEVKAVSAAVAPHTVTSLSTVTATVALKYSNIGLDGSRYVFENLSAELGVRSPVWHLSVFLDLFADNYKRVISDGDAEMVVYPAVKRLGHTLSVVDKALSLINLSDELVEGMSCALSRGAHLVREGIELCAQLPARSNDTLKFFTFLMFFMSRVRSLRVNDSMIIPTSWTAEDGRDHAVILLLTKVWDDHDSNYSVTVINSGSERFQGLDYHAMNIDPTHGQVQRNMSCELSKISNEKITNSAFW